MYKVLKSFKGSPDGYTVIDYAKDEEVDLVPELADVALKEKWVKHLPVKKATEPAVQLEPTSEAHAGPAESTTDAPAAE